jgi:hypothetical protein
MAMLSVELASEINLLERTLNVSISDETYDLVYFGNAVITMKGPECSVRLVRDRDQIFMDIAGASAELKDANDLLRAARLHPSPGRSLFGKELIRLICANFEAIKKLLDTKLDLRPANNDLPYIDHDFSTGWPVGPDLFYQCQHCGDVLSSISDGDCQCGNLFVRASTARAGAVHESRVRLVKQIK